MQHIKKYFGSVEWLLIALFFVVMPFVSDNKLMDENLYSRFFALSIFLLLLSGMLVFRLIKKQINFELIFIEKIVFGLVLFYFFNHIISSIGAINIKEAVFQTLKEGALMLYFFYIYIFMKNSPNGRLVLVKSIIVSTLLFLGIAVKQLLQADLSIFFNANSDYAYYLTQALWDVKSSLANKNPFSAYMYLSLPFIIYGIIELRKYWRVLSIITLILDFAFLALMVSKTVWATLVFFFAVLFILFVIYLFFILPKTSGKVLAIWQKVLVLVAPIIIVVGGVVFLTKSDSKIGNVVVDKVMQVVNPEEYLVLNTKDRPSSLETRILAWGNTFKMIKENPILGVGPGQWRICLPKYGVDRFEESIRNGTKHFQRTHNDFLWILAEIGIFGFLAFISIYLLILYLSLKKFFVAKNNEQRVLSGLIFASLLGYIVILFISFSRERLPHNMLYLAMFAMVLFDNMVNNTKDKPKEVKGVFVKALIVFFILFSGFNLFVTKQIVAGEKEGRKVYINRLGNRNQRGIVRSVERIENTFYTMDSFSSVMSFYKGGAYTKLNEIEKANEAFVEAYRLHPYHVGNLNNLGTSYDLLGQHDKALEIYIEALDISPRYFEALLNAAIIFYNKNNFDEALKYINKIEYSKSHPERYKKSLIAICQRYAAQNQTQFNRELLVDWLHDENKIVKSFVEFHRGRKEFNQILEKELKK